MNKWFQSVWVLRGVSLLLAFFLWFMVSEPTLPFAVNRSSTLVKGIQVEYRYDARQYQLLSPQHKVDLVFTGDKNTINRLPAYHVFADVNNLEAGKYSAVPIEIEGLPSNVQVKPHPATIPMEIAKKVSKPIPVTTTVRGSVADGYRLLPITYTPTTVRVSGIEQEVNKVASISAQVNVDGLKQTVTRDIRLVIHSKTLGKPKVKVTPMETKVTIPVDFTFSPPQQPSKPSNTNSNREFPLEITVSKQPPEGYQVESITTNPEKIRVYGPLDKINTFTIYPGGSIDLSQVTTDTTFTQGVKVITPAVKVAPNTIEIYVKIIRTPT